MFRRSRTDTESAPPPVKEGGKGRPTPTRREAQAAAKARARPPRTRKEQAQRQRELRVESSRKVREAMKTGDERYLPARDRGPVRRFVRDYVDARFSFTELLMPVMFLVLVLIWSDNRSLVASGNTLMLGMVMLTVLDAVLLRVRLRRQLTRRFPGETLKGTTRYAITRALQVRFLRMPKPQVRIGQVLPDDRR